MGCLMMASLNTLASRDPADLGMDAAPAGLLRCCIELQRHLLQVCGGGRRGMSVPRRLEHVCGSTPHTDVASTAPSLRLCADAGMMTGLSLQGNATAAGLLWGLFGLHTLYALLLTIMRPLIDDLTWGTEVTSLWLEALMVLCAALLVYYPANTTYQTVSWGGMWWAQQQPPELPL